MGKIFSTGLLCFCFVAVFAQAQVIESVPVPMPQQLAWQQAEFGVVFHYDVHVFDGKKYNQAENRITPSADYNIFNPIYLNTDQWIASAKAGGATFAILTITHETGFALYQSDINPYCLKAIKWKDGKGDILRDFINSCNKYGIKPGIYIGIRWNSFMGVYDFKVQGDNTFSKNRQSYYNSYCEKMTTELVSRYGKLFFIWFDGGAHGPEQGGPDILPIIEKYQPDAIFYHNLQRADVRWGGSETGTVPYPCWSTFNFPSWSQHNGAKEDFAPIKHGFANGKYYMPAMADAPLRGYNGRHEWFWEPGDETHIFPVQKLIEMYDGSVGHNATLILGLTPNADGVLPLEDADTLKAFGEAIQKRFKQPLAASNENYKNEINIQIPKGKSFSQIVIGEAIEEGQRVRSFSVHVNQKNKWITVLSGTSIGHKFINRFDDPVWAKKIKLVIEKSEGKPLIKQFAVYE